MQACLWQARTVSSHSAHIDGSGGQMVKVKSCVLTFRYWMTLCASVYCVCVPDPRIYFGDRCSASLNATELCGGVSSLNACGEGCCEGLYKGSPTVTASALEDDSCETVSSTRWPWRNRCHHCRAGKTGHCTTCLWSSPFNSPVWPVQKPDAHGEWLWITES